MKAASSLPVDPVSIAQDLLRCRSVTPEDGGALATAAAALKEMGFEIFSLPFGPEGEETPNLYARLGEGRPFLCFAGHTDVVPAGEGWSHPPFGGEIADGLLYGRGAADMKGAVACALAGVARLLSRRPLQGKIAFLLTGDEEGPARFGTRAVLDWMEEQGERPDFCLLGEPSNPSSMGETIKIGRRGSLNAEITVCGRQGHVAYPHLADNPVHRLIALLATLTGRVLDEGSEWFAPSSLQVTSVDVGNEATNVIPARARARVNIRFNDRHTAGTLSSWLKESVAAHAPEASVDIAVSGEAFLTQPGAPVSRLVEAVRTVTGQTPRFDTGGGTSDARFIAPIFPVAEFGLVGATMHQCDEHVSVSSLEELTRIYTIFMESFGL